MQAKGDNQPAGGGAVTNEPASFFDDRAEEKARPVVPLRRDDDADTPTVLARRARGRLPRGPMLALIVVAALAVGAVASYLSFRPGVPATSAEATPSTASGPVSSQPEPAPSRGASDEASGTAAGATRDAGRRDSADERIVPVSRDPKETEERERDAEKLAERARKEEERRLEDEKKHAEREREEAKKRDERRRDEGKRDKPKARLVGTFTERPRP